MHLCGIDEAGRGPIAGPVTAAAVILSPDLRIEGLADSKTLSARRRGALARRICADALAWGVGWASHREIDALNILQATHLAMARAVSSMERALSTRAPLARLYRVVVDGSSVPSLRVETTAVVRADATVPEVMAASILAKEARDAWMVAYDRIDDRYGFARHKGYPTAEHRRRLTVAGACPIHRRSFAPVAALYRPDVAAETR
ncbi:MAG: ribonuclease HII [Spirochaetaceae bacterium]|nr:MAG: ribonuclease HII [Spirochaetaceae bacterium]